MRGRSSITSEALFHLSAAGGEDSGELQLWAAGERSQEAGKGSEAGRRCLRG